jgi:hypothetical protein
MLIPRFDSQLYQEPEDLVDLLSQAVRTARKLGARAISLTGLLPSATQYGRALQNVLPKADAQRITTGHATTTASILLTVQHILRKAERDVSQERVGFVGLGSVGAATLRALLRCLPHPREIRLCDIYNKRDTLSDLRRELKRKLGYGGPVHLLESRGTVPHDLYASSLVIGATNVPDILDADRLAPGTLLVDDSSPHCFRLDRAVHRLREQQDILFTEGGVLRAPQPLKQTIYVPPGLEQVAQTLPTDVFANYDPYHITGCVLSSLLSAQRTDDLPASVGLPGLNTCLAHYEVLRQLGFQAANLHCENFVPDERSIQDFRGRFGRVAGVADLAAAGQEEDLRR